MSILQDNQSSQLPPHSQKMDNTRMSPPPVLKKKTLTFEQALKEAIKGFSITRESWTTQVSFGKMVDDFLMLFIDGDLHVWKVSIGDIEATDWIVND